jgi:hypothetical protein
MLAHSFEAGLDDISIPHLDRDEHLPTTRARTQDYVTSLPRSHYHGFDLGPDSRAGVVSDSALGCYTIDLTVRSTVRPDSALHLRLVALNTAEVLPTTKDEALSARSRGNMSEAQFAWLERQLAGGDAATDVILVAGHHPFSRFVGNQGDRLRDLLAGDPAVAAYLTGHTHVNEIHAREVAGRDLPLWELVGGSMPAYPQFGHVVEVLETVGEPQRFYMRVRTFRQQLGDRACRGSAQPSDFACLVRRERDAVRQDSASAWRHDTTAVKAANGLFAVKR